MKAFARLTALLGLVGVFGATALAPGASAQAPTAAPTAAAPVAGAKSTTVKGYTKKLKNGKTVTVKGYSRKAKGAMPNASVPAPVVMSSPAAPPASAKSVAVKGYTRKTKSGKMVTVKGYTRKAATKKPAASTTPAPASKM